MSKEYKYKFLMDNDKKHYFSDNEIRFIGVRIPLTMFDEFLSKSDNFSRDIMKALAMSKIPSIFTKMFNQLASLNPDLMQKLFNAITEEEYNQLLDYLEHFEGD